MSGPDIFISAGEASGEHYGALLVDALQKRLAALGQTARFFGMGGRRMADAGLEVIVRSEDMAVMGITEVVRHLPRIYREFGRLKRAIRERRPSVAVLIDFPDIHFKLAEQLHALGVPVIFFVSPQLWAWKKHRIRLVQKYIDKMLVIFPFEEQFYREHGVTAEFVGHPLADLPLPTITRTQFAAENALDPVKTWIALLPGSRAKEIRDNLPEILVAARLLSARRSQGEASQEFEFVLPLAPTLTTPQRRSIKGMVNNLRENLTLRLVDDSRAEGAVSPTAGGAKGAVSPTAGGGGASGALFHARASIVASGTATVEAALMGNPFVVVYRVSPITYAIAQHVVTVPHVAMANLIAGQRVVPELIQNNFTAANIVQHLEPLLPDGAPRQSMMMELKRIRSLLNIRNAAPGGKSENAIDRVAAITLEQLGLPATLAETVKS